MVPFLLLNNPTPVVLSSPDVVYMYTQWLAKHDKLSQKLHMMCEY